MAALFWSLLGLAAILSEFAIPEFVMFFVGLGALATAALVALVPPVAGSIPLQLLSWVAFSALSMVALRRRFKNAFGGTIFDRKRRESAVTGAHATVVEAIAPNQPGRVSFQGTTWRALSFDENLPEGAQVEIIKQQGMSLIVTRSMLGELEDELSEHDSEASHGPAEVFGEEPEREWE